MSKITTGVVAHLFWETRILLVLRDKRPGILYPNAWDSITESSEEGETHEETMRRGLREEICMIPADLTMIGVTKAGHGFFVGFLTDRERRCIRLGNEGQAFNFFTLDRVKDLNLGGALKYHLEAYPEAFRKMSSSGTPPDAEELRLSLYATK